MLTKLQDHNVEEQIKQNDLYAQKETVSQTVAEISHITLIENQRMLQVENLVLSY